MEYKITVITALYNAADTMMAAFDSIRAQSMGFDNIQYIIADDCSTDSSCELADSLAARFPNVSVVKLESNSGSDGPPRNAALPFAAAPYLMFLDSDDKLTPRSCELLYNAIERSGADIVSGDVIESFEGGKNDEGGYIVQFKELSAGVYPLEKPTRELCLSFCFNFWSKIYRRELVEKHDIRFGSSKGWADLLFLYSYLSVAERGEILREDVIDYLVRNGSLSHKRSLDFYTSIPRSIERGLDWAAEHGVSERFEELLDLMGTTEYYTDALLEERDFSREQQIKILSAWQRVFTLAHEHGFSLHSAYAKILSRELSLGDLDSALFDLEALRELRYQRETQLSEIFSSRTWKLATALQKFCGRG